MPLPLFSTSSVSTYSQQFKNNKNNSSSISRHQARRVSLPNALLNNQSGGGFRSPRSRTPNSLSPKLGFLKVFFNFLNKVRSPHKIIFCVKKSYLIMRSFLN